MNNKHRGMHAEYCDRIYEHQKSFKNNGKRKVYVVGDSFARYMANILFESEYADLIDLSYSFVYGQIESLNDLEGGAKYYARQLPINIYLREYR